MENNNAFWARALNVKNVVVAFSYLNMKGAGLVKIAPQQQGFLGEAYNVQGQLEIQLFKLSKVGIAISPGMGLSYITQTYRTNDNPLIGSHINMNAGLGAKIEVPFTQSTKLVAGLDVFHFSNTAYKLPNNGVNFINASVGLVERLNAYPKERKVSFAESDRKGTIELGLGIGSRGMQQQFNKLATSLEDSLERKFTGSKLTNIGLMAGYNYRLNPLLSLKAASDVIYYTTTYNVQNYKNTAQEYGTSIDKFSLGLSAGFDIWLNRLVFEGSYGYYLHLNYATIPVYTYWSAGAKYYITPWLAFEVKTRLHKTEAHYTNFGVLFHIKKKRPRKAD